MASSACGSETRPVLATSSTSPLLVRGGCEDIFMVVIPKLQRRGLFQKRWKGAMLREGRRLAWACVGRLQ